MYRSRTSKVLSTLTNLGNLKEVLRMLGSMDDDFGYTSLGIALDKVVARIGSGCQRLLDEIS